MKPLHLLNFSNANQPAPRRSERGSATVIALLVLGLMTIFVTIALTRNTDRKSVV